MLVTISNKTTRNDYLKQVTFRRPDSLNSEQIVEKLVEYGG